MSGFLGVQRAAAEASTGTVPGTCAARVGDRRTKQGNDCCKRRRGSSRGSMKCAGGVGKVVRVKTERVVEYLCTDPACRAWHTFTEGQMALEEPGEYTITVRVRDVKRRKA